MSTESGRNALQHETSPYLLQHADNPVDWYPWNEEALQKARLENKPILLSIGYSACHWCHVMAHESFEDEQTADLMNEHFINIKIDREERPDLDRIYQTAQHMLTQKQGGWPLTMFLTPDDHIPFFGGTYFPKEARFGLPGFKEVLLGISDFYHNKIEDLRKQNNSFKEALARLESPSEPTDNELTINDLPLRMAYQELAQSFDHHYGGFGGAPKFPHPTNLECLLQYATVNYSREEQTNALEISLFTLEQMARGGIYDHIGGGFARYSVDQYWMIPHFEKMLYDNGPLLSLYCLAWQFEQRDLFKQVALETADWVMREMQSEEGGYYSSLDADSEGVEGKFYAWDRDEILKIIPEDTFPLFEFQYGLNNPPNFEGKWHLYLSHTLDETAKQFSISVEECSNKIEQARNILFNTRKDRVHPGRDDKVLGSWNALMIKGMAVAGQTFNHEDYIDSACNAVNFIQNTLWQNHRLLATYKDGKAHLNAYLDDYAFLIDAILQLLQSRWNIKHLHFAISLADSLLEQFEDKKRGGFFFTSHDHEQLIQRNKPFMDDALPAGNGIAALALFRLGHLLGEIKYIEAAEATLKAAWSSITRIPYAHTALLLALNEYLRPSSQLILRGKQEEIESWQKQIQEHHPSSCLCFAINDEETDLPGLLSQRQTVEGTAAYLCQGTQCLPPINHLEALIDHLKFTNGE